MKKKLLSILLASLLVLGTATGCSTDSGGKPSGSGTASSMDTVSSGGSYKEKKVAFIATDMSLTYAAWLADSLKKQVGDYPGMTIDYYDGAASVATQLSILDNCVSMKYDYIILHPQDPNAEADYVRNIINENGIPVLMVNQSDGGVENASNVDCDPVAYGEMIAKVADQMMPKGKKDHYNVVVLLGPSGNSHSIGRRKGYENVLFSKRPDIKILDEQIGDWEKSKGMNLMEDWLQAYPEIDAVLSMNDAMAIGAYEAAEAVGRQKNCLFFGVDGLADSVLSIKGGGLTATVQQSAYTQAQQSLEIIDKVFKRETKFEKVDTDPVLITSKNVQDFYDLYVKMGLIKK